MRFALRAGGQLSAGRTGCLWANSCGLYSSSLMSLVRMAFWILCKQNAIKIITGWNYSCHRRSRKCYLCTGCTDKWMEKGYKKKSWNVFKHFTYLSILSNFFIHSHVKTFLPKKRDFAKWKWQTSLMQVLMGGKGRGRRWRVWNLE